LKKKIHVLFLSSWYPSKLGLTNGNFVQQHAESIAKTHKVSVIYPIGSYLTKKTSLEISTKNHVESFIIYFKKHPNLLVNAFRKQQALKLGISQIEKFDLIHGNIFFPIGPFVWLISKKFNVPYIFTEHWTDYKFPLNKSIGLLQKIITKKVAKDAQFITVVTNSLKEDLENFGIFGNYKIIGNIINTKKFIPKKKNNALFTLLHISTLENQQKNISGILRVIKRISLVRNDFKFHIVGSANLPWLKEKVDHLKIPKGILKIEGTKNQTQLIEIYQKSDLYLSFSNYETFGIVIAESLATGTAVISTNTGIVNELQPTDYLTKVSMGNEDELFKLILERIDKNPTYDGHQMHTIISKKYNTEVISKKIIDLYTLALNKNYE
jgi:glycosyltransferase involved in cell wall biosynthesis